MKKGLFTLIFTGLVAGSMLTSPAFAQDEEIPGHPRVNEVDQRLENQQGRVNNGVEQGQMNGREAVRDEHRDARVQHQLSRDETRHNGHVTKGEQRRMNRELNRNSHDIHRQRHHTHRRHPGAQ